VIGQIISHDRIVEKLAAAGWVSFIRPRTLRVIELPCRSLAREAETRTALAACYLTCNDLM
jgi:hypothetical protein